MLQITTTKICILDILAPNPIYLHADDFLQRLAFSSLICNLLSRSSCKILLGESKQMRTFSTLNTYMFKSHCPIQHDQCSCAHLRELENCNKHSRYTDFLSNFDLCTLPPSCIENPNPGVKHDAEIHN